MIDDSIRLLMKTVVANHPEILNDREIFGSQFSVSKKRKKFGKPQIVRLEANVQERINSLISDEWRQSDLLRKAIEFGLPTLEKEISGQKKMER